VDVRPKKKAVRNLVLATDAIRDDVSGVKGREGVLPRHRALAVGGLDCESERPLAEPRPRIGYSFKVKPVAIYFLDGSMQYR
jgi:hypothetical protein